MGRRSRNVQFKHEAVKLVTDLGITTSRALSDLDLPVKVLPKSVMHDKASSGLLQNRGVAIRSKIADRVLVAAGGI